MSQATNVARRVISSCLQSWGQSIDEKVQAWQDAFNFMNLSATVNVGKDGDGHMALLFDGSDADKAKKFVLEVKGKFPLGDFHAEVTMIEDCFNRYIKT